MRSIPIAFAGGLALGVIQNLIAGYGDDFLPGFLKNLDGFRAAVPFILTLIILIFAGRDRGRAGGTIADEKPPPDHRDGLSAWRRRLPWVIATLALVAFTMQWIDVAALQADTYEQGIIAKGMVFAVIFLSFVVVTGIGGMVSLSQATFVIAGGFAAGWAVNHNWGVDVPLIASHGQLNWLWAVVLAALVGAASGAIVALPVRRLGAVALALGTFALAFTADLVIFAQGGHLARLQRVVRALAYARSPAAPALRLRQFGAAVHTLPAHLRSRHADDPRAHALSDRARDAGRTQQ